MNLLEYSFSSASNRASRSINELAFEHTTRDANTRKRIVHRVSISFSSKFGRPTIEDDEVYVGFQALTHDRRQSGCDSPRLEFTRYELLKAIGWRDTGPNYAKIDRAINRIGGVWVVAENAFYDRHEASWVDKRFHIIDESHLFTREKYDFARANEATSNRPRSWIKWGEPFYQSFCDGYLATFDLEVYRGIRGGVAKKLFRYANKRLWKRDRFSIALRCLAEEKLGFKSGQFESELARSLESSFRELQKLGLNCTLKQKGKCKHVQVIRLTSRPQRSKSPSNGQAPSLVQELVSRGIDNAIELVQRFDAQKIRDQIENFEDRRANGSDVSPGWLRCAIEADKGYGFRKGFKSSRQLAEEKREKASRRAARTATKAKEDSAVITQQLADKESFAKFLRLRDSFSEKQQLTLEDEAMTKCNEFVCRLVLKARRDGDIGMFHQMLWEQHIIPILADEN